MVKITDDEFGVNLNVVEILIMEAIERKIANHPNGFIVVNAQLSVSLAENIFFKTNRIYEYHEYDSSKLFVIGRFLNENIYLDANIPWSDTNVYIIDKIDCITYTVLEKIENNNKDLL